jgi:hypothetical protein
MSLYTDLNRCLAADPKANILLRIITLLSKAQGEEMVWVDDFEITSIE